jgi:hypothetical protein
MPGEDYISLVLAKHISQTIDDIAVQINHAQRVNGRARSGYYRVAILLAASLVEAMLYGFILHKCDKEPELNRNVKRFKKSKEATTLIELPKATLGSQKELWICEINRHKIDKMHGFKDMNDYDLEIGIISKRLYTELEFVRNKRNEIHLQTLDSSARNYNSRILDRVANAFFKILDLQ